MTGLDFKSAWVFNYGQGSGRFMVLRKEGRQPTAEYSILSDFWFGAPAPVVVANNSPYPCGHYYYC